jgi:hypothetical protein
MLIAGQIFSEEIIERIAETVCKTADLSRCALSRLVCEWLNWKNPAGQAKESSCRVALLKLARLGVIPLPAARQASFTARKAGKTEEEPAWTQLKTTLAKLSGVKLVLVNGDKKLSWLWRMMMKTHHPLGDGPICGAQLRYLVASDQGYLGGLSFSSPAWRLRARDEWIGWSEATRAARLSRIVQNSRFLVLPTVEVPHLASHILSLATKQLANDWQQYYGEKPVLIETFVDSEHHKGTCYLAANWKELGFTEGRGRQDKERRAKLSRKQVLVYPLQRNWRKVLTAPLEFPRIIPSARITEPSDWVEEEFGECQLNKRLTHRLITIARQYYGHPMANIPEACDGDASKMQATYRFLAHEDATFETVLQPHFAATERRIREMASGVVLVPQDTTSLNYTNLVHAEGFGPIGTTADGAQGLHLHSSLAMTAEGVPLGFLDALCWARDPEEFGKKARRSQLPIEEKESYRWLSNYQAVAAVQARNPHVTLVSVGDREADIYELFAEAAKIPNGPKLLVRAQHDREIQGEQTLLIETMEAMPIAGHQEVHLPRQKDRKARDAKLTIRHAAVTLLPPRTKPHLPPITVWAVLAREERAPKDAEPIDWLVLTTVAVQTLDEASERLQWYAKRWTIEVFHRTLKSGCRIEDRQLQDADRIQTCLAIDMVIAWRICFLVKLGREVPDMSCDVYFEEAEWKSLVIHATKKLVPPDEPPPSLGKVVRMIAQLGGFLGRKLDGEPGTECLWRGFHRLYYLVRMWLITGVSGESNSPQY